jgi:hypothetical protein
MHPMVEHGGESGAAAGDIISSATRNRDIVSCAKKRRGDFVSDGADRDARRDIATLHEGSGAAVLARKVAASGSVRNYGGSPIRGRHDELLHGFPNTPVSIALGTAE